MASLTFLALTLFVTSRLHVGFAAVVKSEAGSGQDERDANRAWYGGVPSSNLIPRMLEEGPEVQCHLWLLQ